MNTENMREEVLALVRRIQDKMLLAQADYGLEQLSLSTALALTQKDRLPAVMVFEPGWRVDAKEPYLDDHWASWDDNEQLIAYEQLEVLELVLDKIVS